jgi:hypothetical protein
LNSEMIWKIWKKSKLKSGKIRNIRKKIRWIVTNMEIMEERKAK